MPTLHQLVIKMLLQLMEPWKLFESAIARQVDDSLGLNVLLLTTISLSGEAIQVCFVYTNTTLPGSKHLMKVSKLRWRPRWYQPISASKLYYPDDHPSPEMSSRL